MSFSAPAVGAGAHVASLLGAKSYERKLAQILLRGYRAPHEQRE
jgi:hypothetical protein